MARKIETTIALDGEQKFKQGMDSAARAMRVLESEGRALAASLADEGSAAQQAAAKQRNLQQQIAQQQQIVSALEKAVKDAANAYGENSKEVDGYAIKLNNARTKLANLQKTLKSADKEVEELGRDSVQAGRQLERGIGEGAQEAESDLKSMMSTMQDSLSAIQGSTAVTAIKTIWDTATGAFQALDGYVTGTQEYRRQLAFLMFNAGQNDFGLEYTREMLIEAQAMTADASTAIEGLSNLLQIGFTGESNLETAMRGLLGATFKWPDTLKFESLSDSLQETIATGQVVGQIGELYERLGISLDDVNKALAESPTKEGDIEIMLAYLKSEELTDAYEKFREENKDLVEELEVVARLESESARIGEILAKNLWTPAQKKGAEVLGWVADVLESLDSGEPTGIVKEAEEKAAEETAKAAAENPQLLYSGLKMIDALAGNKPVWEKFSGAWDTAAGIIDAMIEKEQESKKSGGLAEGFIGPPTKEQAETQGNGSTAVERITEFANNDRNIKKQAAKDIYNWLPAWAQNALESAAEGIDDFVKNPLGFIFGTAGAEEADPNARQLSSNVGKPAIPKYIPFEQTAAEGTYSGLIDPFAYQMAEAAATGVELAMKQIEQASQGAAYRTGKPAIPQYIPFEPSDAEKAGEQAAESYLNGFETWIDMTNLGEPKLAEPFDPTEMQQVGEEAGENLLDGMKSGVSDAEGAAEESGAAFAVAYARGITSKVDYVTSAASAMGAAAARAAAAGAAGARSASPINISLSVDGRQFARATAPYMSAEMVTLRD